MLILLSETKGDIRVKKKTSFILILSLLLILAVGCSNNEGEEEVIEYPEKPITMVVPWSVGGITDRVARTFQPILEEKMGQTISIVNKEGASGAIGTEYAYDQDADGYTLLFSAETPALFRVMDVNDLSFDNFEFINMLVHDTKVVVVPADSEYETFESLIIDIKENPGKIKMSYSGPGASGHIQGLLFQKVGLDVSMTPYGGGNPSMLATISGEVDFTFGNYATIKDYLESGELRALATFTEAQSDIMPDVEPVTSALPEIEDYLPMYFPNSILVKEDTPEEVQDFIKKAVEEAIADERWQDFLEAESYTSLGSMTEEEIEDYWEKYTSINAWLLYDAGVVDKSPEEFDIERYDE